MIAFPILLLIAAGGIAAGAAVREKSRGIASKTTSTPDLKIPSELYQRGIKACQISDPAAIASVASTIAHSIGQTFFGMLLAQVQSDLLHNNLPSAKSEADSTLATTDLIAKMLANVKNPDILVRYAGEFSKFGLKVSAGRLQDKARTYAAGIPGLPPGLQAIVAKAQEENTPEAYSSAAYALEQAGYIESAKVFRDKAAQLSQAKGAPPASQWPNQSTNPTMAPDLAAEVARIMRDSNDPTVLHALAKKLRALGYGATADQLDAKAAQIEAAHVASSTMQEIEKVMHEAGTTTELPPQVITADDGTVVLTPKSPEMLAAQNMTRALFALLQKYGSVKTAKQNYAQVQGAVLAFQKLHGGADGLYGPGTAKTAARYVDAVPIVLYWPKLATKQTVHTYLSDIETLALDAEQNNRSERAESLRASMQDEVTHGIGPGEPGYGK